MQRDLQHWLSPRLRRAAACQAEPAVTDIVAGPLSLGIDLGTCDVVSMVLDTQGIPVAVRLDWADVVRDGVVWDFYGAVTLVRRQLDSLQEQLGVRFTQAATSFPPGTEPRISINVLEAAGLDVTCVIDEPSAVARMLRLKSAAVVDIGGGTTGVAVVRDGQVIHSADEPTGGHHVSLVLAGHLGIALEEAEQRKRREGEALWPLVRPVFEKMTDIVRQHLRGFDVDEIYLSGGSCTLPGVQALFAQAFPQQRVLLPAPPLFTTPLAIASCGLQAASGVSP
ncbi:ethanolamine utilization protein EutJ [Pseudomonas nicosulfuronedens]|uniref:Ethanolamine utilization protein EutJ n=1 Tax=Pseudomonas nicosulfuronedens TaxID=2571105 RepID=A0A5R9RBI5_9PSED|nr:ethanolamine utilization protein EutJ [Pseudomonas nicosulfuronedens]MDH1008020.1 ethanolamine utilization protein EutJ [Pseudomonas nicosulfuronedens]MDH1978278.1 ethanolamine utilization protein EutJ [Pseudomonas nicosulfuronedens]MDH2025131.1 ethanolamine utilization protein EutJ [Pseudomonas nicosulfuronedens]TLX80633.1 ethanolamine utilization protein EutJ [Pseudomonas nicosulfuronedens]